MNLLSQIPKSMHTRYRGKILCYRTCSVLGNFDSGKELVDEYLEGEI